MSSSGFVFFCRWVRIRRRVALVADILGHADVRTTRRYTRSTIEDGRAAMQDLDS